MFGKVAVPLDGSRAAEEILQQAREIARSRGSKLSLLRVVHVREMPGVDPTDAQVRAMDGAADYLDKLKLALAAEGFSVETSVRYGQAAEEILAHVSRTGCDLIAMATHGRTGPARWVFGSVAENVLRHADVPVLLVCSSQGPSDREPRAAVAYSSP